MAVAPAGWLAVTDGSRVVFLNPNSSDGSDLFTYDLPAASVVKSGTSLITKGGFCQLPTGELMMATNEVAAFFSATLAGVTKITLSPTITPCGAAAHSDDRFFIGTSRGIATYTGAGAADTTVTTSASDRDESYLGVATDGSFVVSKAVGSQVVEKIVLAGGSSTVRTCYSILPAPGLALVLQDGAVVIFDYDSAAPHNAKIFVYEPGGSLRTSRAYGSPTSYPVALARGATASYFWVAWFDTITSRTYFYKASASSTFSTLTVPGLYQRTGGPVDWARVAIVELVAGVTVPPPRPPFVAPVAPETPLGPQTPCTPQAQVSGGGMGAAGCNVGGVGRTPIAFTAYGSAPDHADPTPGETLTGSTGADLWIALHHKAYPSGTITTYRRALVELADAPSYYGGRKESGLLTVGDVEHGLGNESGNFEAATCTLTFSDAADRWIRSLLDEEELEGDEIEVYLASRAARDAGTAPRTLMRGVVQGPTTETGLKASLSAVDLLFSIFGPFGQTPNYPFWTFGDVFPDAPSDVRARCIPPLYGPKSDAGATDPITGASREKGLVPWHLVGSIDISGTDANALLPTTEDAAVGAVTETGVLGGSGEWLSDGTVTNDPYHFVARVAGGSMGPLAGGRSSTPSASGTAYGFRPVWNDAADYADYYLVFQVPAAYSTWDPFTNPAPADANIRYKTVSATPSNPYADWQYIAYFTSEDDGARWGETAPAETWDLYGVLLGASYQGGAVYGSDLGGGDPSKTHDRAKVDLASRNGADILWPWNEDGTPASAWPFANTFMDFTAPDGRVFRLTIGLARGAISDDHKNGVVNLTCNMRCGREDVGDGTGLPLVDAHLCQQHWIENELLGRYSSGLYVTNSTAPKWPDGTYKVRSSRFRDRQAFTAAALGGRGLTVGWYVGMAKPIGEHCADWNIATETQMGLNSNGSVSLGYIDETVDPSTWPRVQHVTDVFGPIRSQHRLFRENCITASCDWDPEAGKARIGPIVRTNDAAIGRYKGIRKPGQDVVSPILDDLTQLQWVMDRRLLRLGDGLTVVDVPGTMGLLDTDVDDPGIQLTTIEGTGADGYIDRPMQVRRRRFAFGSRRAILTLWDVHNYLLATRVTDGLARRPTVTDGSPGGMIVTDNADQSPLVLV